MSGVGSFLAKNTALIPLLACVVGGLGLGVGIMAHQLTRGPEVTVDRHRNPQPWNAVQQWQTPKLFNYHKEFFDNRKNIPRNEY